MESPARRLVGTSPPRVDARARVTGRTRYMTDLAISGMVHARLWRSPLPHARLERLEAQAARAAPGVLAVLTAADLTGCEPLYGPLIKDQPLLAGDRIRYAGEPVAMVVAETERQAAAALRRLEVTLTPLPAVFDPEAALAPGAPLVHEQPRLAGHLPAAPPLPGSNVCHHYTAAWGDAAAGMAEAEAVFTDTFRLPALLPYALEPPAAIARYEPSGLTVWTATQHPFPVRQQLAEAFGLPLAAVQVIVPPMGGAFGARWSTTVEPLAVLGARQVQRPVRLALTATEAGRTHTSHAAVCRLETGVRRDGTLVARRCDILFDTGAYADVGPWLAARAGALAAGPYRLPHVRIDCRAVYTNRVPAGAYRGAGIPQVTWASESQLDRIAAALGLDPLALRLRNLLGRGERLAPGALPMDADLAAGLRLTAARGDWHTPAGRPRGKGLAGAVKDGGMTPGAATAVVRIHADGSVTLFAGAVEHGQGALTVLSQLVAEVLDVDLELVTVTPPDTSITPYDQGTSGSRTTTLLGRAVYAASQDAGGQLLAMAAALLGVPRQAVRLEGGVLTAGEQRLTFAETIAQHFGHPGGEVIGTGVCTVPRQGPPGAGTGFWQVGMGSAEVEVDAETGAVTVHRYLAVADVGRALHPRLCAAQQEGAAMQGLGAALFEGLMAADGQVPAPDLHTYRLPLFTDLPPLFDSARLEHADGPGPYGVKGMGESGTFCVAAAIGNAIAGATGVSLHDLPLTPERVWRALRAGGQAPGLAGQPATDV